MNFDFSDEQKQMRDEARKFLSEQCPPKAVREVLDGKAPYDKSLWKGLAEMGFLGVAIPEQFGGAGAGHLELCVIAEEMGRALAPVPFSSTVYLAAEALLIAGSDAQKQKWLPKIASGDAIGTLALFEGKGNPSPKAVKVTANGGVLNGVKKPVADGAIADFAVVAARTGSSGRESDISLFIVDLKAAGVEVKSLTNIDLTRGQAEITFRNAKAEPLGAAGEGWSVITQVLDRAAVLTAFEQVGGTDRALEMGRDYALDRIAFGRPLGSFQAVQQELADVYIVSQTLHVIAQSVAWRISEGLAGPGDRYETDPTIGAYWLAHREQLGAPSSRTPEGERCDEAPTPVCRQSFDRADLLWDAAHGAQPLRGAFRGRYEEAMGAAEAPERTLPGGVVLQSFLAADGTRTVLR